jgi:hypothetical protein
MMTERDEKSKIEKRLDIARGVFGIAIAICALITIMLFGANMDTANLPGSNIKIALHEHEPKEGQMKAVLDGFLLEHPIGASTSTECTNFVSADADATTLTLSGSKQLCMSSVEGKETDPQEKGKPWSSGWVSALDCPRTIDTGKCAPFSAWGPLAIFGMLTFGLSAIQTILFTAHSGVALAGGEMSLASARKLVQDQSSRVVLGLVIVWGLLGFGLSIWAAFSFQSMCDKLDTGLGRIVQTTLETSDSPGAPACATSGCESSFLYFFMTYAIAVVWSSIPYVLVWFGVLESA